MFSQIQDREAAKKLERYKENNYDLHDQVRTLKTTETELRRKLGKSEAKNHAHIVLLTAFEADNLKLQDKIIRLGGTIEHDDYFAKYTSAAEGASPSSSSSSSASPAPAGNIVKSAEKLAAPPPTTASTEPTGAADSTPKEEQLPGSKTVAKEAKSRENYVKVKTVGEEGGINANGSGDSEDSAVDEVVEEKNMSMDANAAASELKKAATTAKDKTGAKEKKDKKIKKKETAKTNLKNDDKANKKKKEKTPSKEHKAVKKRGRPSKKTEEKKEKATTKKHKEKEATKNKKAEKRPKEDQDECDPAKRLRSSE